MGCVGSRHCKNSPDNLRHYPDTPSIDAAVEETPKVEIDVKSDGQGTDTRSNRDYGYRGGSSYDGGGRGRYGDRSRPMSDDEKLKRYKKQSEERLLDIKRSREAKIGKRRGR